MRWLYLTGGCALGMLLLERAICETPKEEPETVTIRRDDKKKVSETESQLVSNTFSEHQVVLCDGHDRGVGHVALSADGKVIVSSDKSCFVRVCDSANSKVTRKFQVFPTNAKNGFISALAMSPDGKVVAVAASGQPVQFWDAATGKRLDGELAVKQAVYSLAFSPNGSKLAVGEHAQVNIWDVQSRKVLQQFKFDDRLIWQACGVVFSADGAQLASPLLDSGGSYVSRAAKVRVWDVQTGVEVFSAWPDQSASAVSFSNDGKLAAGGGRVIEVWDLKTKQSLRRFDLDQTAVRCLTFTPDGQTIMTGGNHPSITLWNAASSKRVGELTGHKKSIHFLRFSGDGKTLVSAGGDAILIWPEIKQQLTKFRDSSLQKE